MCAWNSTWPNGALSVAANQPTGAANTTYIKTTMNVDHYWDESSDNDGHHQFVQMTQSGTAAVPVDVTLATGMEGAYYAKAKSTTEAPDNQDVQPFYKNNQAVGVPGTTEVMQLMGMRSCGLVTIGATPTFTIVEKYSHNLTSITRSAIGVYDISFPALPTAYYLPYVMALRRGVAGQSAVVSIDGTTKTTTGFRVLVTRSELATTRTDPSELWFFVFGG